jgi:hypothetical protein
MVIRGFGWCRQADANICCCLCCVLLLRLLAVVVVLLVQVSQTTFSRFGPRKAGSDASGWTDTPEQARLRAAGMLPASDSPALALPAAAGSAEGAPVPAALRAAMEQYSKQHRQKSLMEQHAEEQQKGKTKKHKNKEKVIAGKDKAAEKAKDSKAPAAGTIRAVLQEKIAAALCLRAGIISLAVVASMGSCAVQISGGLLTWHSTWQEGSLVLVSLQQDTYRYLVTSAICAFSPAALVVI